MTLLVVFLRLKAALLRNGFRNRGAIRVGPVALFAASALGGAGMGLVFWRDTHRLGDAGPVTASTLLPGFTMLFLTWLIGPLLLGGVDDSLDPRRLALLPLRRREVALGLTVGGMIGPMPLMSVLAMAGVVAGTVRGPADVLVVGACLVHVAACFVSGRLFAVVLALGSATRRGRDLTILVASCAAAGLWMATQSLTTVSTESYARIASVLRWTPPGLLSAAVADAKSGSPLAASVRMAVVVALTLAGGSVWARLLQSLLSRSGSAPRRRRAETPVSTFLRWSARFAIVLGGPRAGAVFVKEAAYLLRAPSRRSALLVSTVMGVPFVTLQVLRLGGFRPGCVVWAPAALLFGLGSVNNLIGSDSMSLWLEVSSGVKLRELLIGRGLASVPYLVLPSLVTAIALAVGSASVKWLAEVLLLVMLGWGVALGVGSVVSVRAPFAQPDDANPFSNTTSAGGVSGAVALLMAAVSSVVVALLDAPLVALAFALRDVDHAFGALAAVTFVYSIGVWRLGVRWSVRHVERHGIDFVTLLGPRHALQ